MHRTHLLIYCGLFPVLLACACQAQTIRIFDIGTKDGSFTRVCTRSQARVACPLSCRRKLSGERLVCISTWPLGFDRQPQHYATRLDKSAVALLGFFTRSPSRWSLLFRHRPGELSPFTSMPSSVTGDPAPPRYAVIINGKPAGSYQLTPRPSPELWWPNGGESDGNMQYFGYESLDMTFPASTFTNGSNTLSVQCLDGFGIFYDHFSLVNDRSANPPLVTGSWVEPSVLYKNRASGLVELARSPHTNYSPIGPQKAEGRRWFQRNRERSHPDGGRRS